VSRSDTSNLGQSSLANAEYDSATLVFWEEMTLVYRLVTLGGVR